MNTDNFLETIISSSSEIISLEELKILYQSKKDLLVKIGFDPTTSDLHLGHLVIIRKLMQLQKIGFKICVIIGDFTAMIGDPSGKNVSRLFISRDQIISNYQTYINQLFKFLDPKLTNVYFNSSWYDFFCVENFIRLSSFSTVSRMLERNDFKGRFNDNVPIGLNEFIYPLLQAYDSVFLNVDIEIGGIDQKFNFLLGREIQKRFFQKSQVAIMMPLLIGLDGKNKMSKSLGNCIGLNDDFYEIFCKVMSISDILMKDYFLYLDILNAYDYYDLIEKTTNPMDVKLFLAFEIVSMIYNSELACIAKDRFLNIFSKKVVPSDIDCFVLEKCFNSILLSEVLLKLKFISSNSEFKRFLNSGSVEVNEEVVSDKLYLLYVDTSYFVKVGKKKFVKIFLKKN